MLVRVGVEIIMSSVVISYTCMLLSTGTPTGSLPHIAERSENYRVVFGSKYAVEAERVGRDGYEQAKKTSESMRRDL